MKSLAKKTSDAASDIRLRIEHISNATAESVSVITNIASSVRTIDDANNGMAAAAEEQGATLHEITRALAAASSDVGTVASSIGAITTKAEQVQAQSRAAMAANAQTDSHVSNLRETLIAPLRASTGRSAG